MLEDLRRQPHFLSTTRASHGVGRLASDSLGSIIVLSKPLISEAIAHWSADDRFLIIISHSLISTGG